MEMDTLIAHATSFYYSHTWLAIAIVALIVLVAYFKPKQTLKLAAFVAVMSVVFYLLSLLSGTLFTGTEQKDKAIHRSKESLEYSK